MNRLAHSLAVLGSAVLSLAQDDPDVRIESLAGPLLQFARGGDAPCHVRIVDASTQQPVSGALLYVVRERSHPTGGEFWFDAKWQADADGFVRFPGEDVPADCWVFVGADGFGTLAASKGLPTHGDGVVELMPGVDWPLDVRDAFDRPLGGVDLGLCLGCGHTPDVRWVTSDLLGRAVLRCVEPAGFGSSTNRDLYPRGAERSPEYQSHRWQLGDPPTRLRLPSSRFVRGSVRSPNGRPVPGIAITSDRRQHRGPWSRTDANGVFAPIACIEWLVLQVGEREYTARPPAVADTFELTLPPAPLPSGQPKARVTVVVQDPAGRPLPGCRVALWHVGIHSADPAESVGLTTDAAGQGVAEVVAGQLGLEVAAPTSTEVGATMFAEHRRDFVVGANAEERVVVALSPWSTMRIRAADGVETVTLVTQSDAWTFDLEPGVERRIAVPGDEPFALHAGGVVGVDASTRFFAFPSPPRDVVEIAPWPPTPVRLRVLDARGQPVGANVWLLDRNASDASDAVHTDGFGRAVMTTERVGCAFVRIEPDLPGPRCRDVHIGLPRRGEGLFDLGDVVLPDAPALRVLRADGRAGRGRCELRRPGLVITRSLAADGGWDGPALQAGDRVEVRLDDDEGGGGAPAIAVPADVEVLRLPLAMTLRGDGPWTLREGSARLRLSIVDDHGMFADDAVVLCGATAERLQRHTVELQGLPAGASELFVGASSCDSAKVRVVLKEGEERRLDVVLRRRL